MRAKARLLPFLLACLLLSAVLPAFAAEQSTKLTAAIPCTVSLQVGANGKATVNGIEYASTGSLSVSVGTVHTYYFTPNAGYEVDKLVYNGADVTAQLSANRYTAPALSDHSSLSVSFRPSVSVFAITTQPTNQHVVVGQRAMFTIRATGDSMTYQWYINRNDGTGWKTLDGAMGTSYTTAVVEQDCNGYRYGCVVRDKHGNTLQSDVATLYVSAAPVIPQTGDNNHPMLYLALLVVSCLGLVVLGKKRLFGANE